MNIISQLRTQIMTYTIERKPRVLRNEKLAVSGNPERYIPLSTIEKLSGGV